MISASQKSQNIKIIRRFIKFPAHYCSIENLLSHSQNFMASLEHSGLCSSEEAQGKDASCFRHVVQNQCSVVVAIESRVDCNSKGYLGILDKEDRSIL